MAIHFQRAAIRSLSNSLIRGGGGSSGNNSSSSSGGNSSSDSINSGGGEQVNSRLTRSQWANSKTKHSVPVLIEWLTAAGIDLISPIEDIIIG